MSRIDMLRLLITQRLTAAAEEIFAVFGKTVAEYEEQISRYRLELHRQRHLLELRDTPRIRLHAQKQGWSCEAPPIKEEQEEEPLTSGQNHVELLFQNPPDLHTTSSASELPDQDQEDPELGPLDPDPELGPLDPEVGLELGPSPQQSGSDPVQDRPEAAELSEAVDSYICTVCGRAFAQRAHWAQHAQVHRKPGSRADGSRADGSRADGSRTDKSFACEICGKRLTRFDGYQKHLRIHTGEKPYSCDECGRRFSDNSNYKRHIRTHGTRAQTS